nr:MAG TPA: RUBREDOXIN TRANSPORT, RUBREDOXIN, GUILLARDIA THETA [Caudoviricetes sp.]
MARMRKQQQEKPKYQCRHCQHSYDWHEKNWRGEFFMCRCKFSEWCKFLSTPQCEHFLKREDADNGTSE